MRHILQFSHFSPLATRWGKTPLTEKFDQPMTTIGKGEAIEKYVDMCAEVVGWAEPRSHGSLQVNYVTFAKCSHGPQGSALAEATLAITPTKTFAILLSQDLDCSSGPSLTRLPNDDA